MFDYVNKLQLALGDKARRTGLKAGAGAALLVGAGFLVAALWSWLAWNLELGPALASLIIAVLFMVIGGIIWMMAKAQHHPMPTTDELKHEVEARLALATDAALDKAKFKAEEAMDSAQARVVSLYDQATGKVRRVVNRTEDKARDLASDAEQMAGTAARKVGLTDDNIDAMRDTVDRAVHSRAAPGIGVAGAFAIGIAIASALKGRSDDDEYDDFDDYDYV
ncbi:phage holin family protein [Paracoccus jeotgali]|uniref:Phage holin family protein n=1 Tax=Paracoccus jeotgali TaxID=2065379 RepID=A0A2K9MDX7_9RHOB|nr:phage holin family protein [Paracoccus jeotgali]AUM73804.1 hypothetical protein CYR75_05450 [Paracoccus jeotgali]